MSAARPAAARERAAPLFAAFGLEGFEGARPAELSGGMRQRVAFLRTLLSGKPVLCLDEPFGALDALTRREMQEWLAGALAREPRTVLLVTHDVEEAVLLADRVLVLSPRPGRIVAELDVACRPAAPGRRSRPRRAARARAGGAARVIAGALAPAVVLLVFLGGWEPYARLGAVDDFILPAPTEIAQALWRTAAALGQPARHRPGGRPGDPRGAGARRGAGGRAALLAALRRGAYPLLVASQAVPVVIIAPLLVVWFGFGILPKLAIIALVCFFPVVVTTLDALRAVDPDQLKLCAPWTPRAGRPSAWPSCPPPCRPR